tara:strand:- start:5173 stop:5892 length:720 start_codon:yes stop_codon:yes gene_type:complete
MKYYFTIILTSIVFTQDYFTNIPDATGVTHLVIIENIIGLENGDEIGVFDSNGLINTENCLDQYGELLVGASVYDGSQISIPGIISIDYCDLTDGYQLSGAVVNNQIMIKVWDRSENIEYVIDNTEFEIGGDWDDGFFSVIDQLTVNELSININSNFNLFEIYPNPFNSTISIQVNNSLVNPYHIQIFNLSGKLVETIDYKNFQNNSISWDASNLNSGIYLVNFISQDKSLTKKITLVK